MRVIFFSCNPSPASGLIQLIAGGWRRQDLSLAVVLRRAYHAGGFHFFDQPGCTVVTHP